jgi:calcium-translocating P-type ATPase
MGKMLIVATGERSQWGLTLKELSDDRQETPLQQTLGDLAEMIGMVGLGVALIVFFVMMIYWGLEIWEEKDWDWRNLAEVIDFFIIAVTIVVVAVPEGLPLAVTISLAYSMKQMIADNNLVRKLAACETMGGVTDICSDKTGTLTENKMTLEKGWLVGEEFSNVPPTLNATPQVMELIHQCIALNSSPSTHIVLNENGLPPKFIGNKTECALLMFSHLCGFDYEKIRKEHELVKVYAFSSNRKRMSCVVAGHGGFILYCKGAPEMVLRDASSVMRADGQSMPLTPEMRDQLLEYVESMASMGLRTLCLSFRFMPYFNVDVEVDPPEQGLTILGFVGIRDPIRKEVPEAVRKCQLAGVTVRMVTGDNIITAKKIAEEAGILTEEGVAIEGPAFAKMTDEEIDNILPNLQVLARSLPMDKLRLVQRLMANKHVVGVTGDGTNDAPALKQADVGLSMGIAGTDVAKEASDIIILDDNFNSCVFSILWGRCIFDNIRKFLQFQLTVNLSALTVAFIGAVSQRGTPLSVLQLLWVNLIMDTMAALALGTEKPHPDLLERPPININRAWLISNIMMKNIVGQGVYQVVILCFILFAGPYIWYLDDGSNRHYTLIFNSFVFAQVFNELNSRKCNGELNVFDGLFTNWIFIAVLIITVSLQVIIIEFGSVAFQTAALSTEEWFTTVLIGFGSLPLGLILRVIPVPVMDAWGFGEVEQKLRSDSKIKRMRDRYEASKRKGKKDFQRFEVV